MNQSPTNQTIKDLGIELTVCRTRERLTQTEAAERAEGKFSRNTLIAMETGKYNYGIRQLTDYLDVLGYEIQFVKKAPTA